MKVPLKWIKEYIDVPEDLKVFTDKMSMIGHLLDKLEETPTDTVVDFELRGNRADCYSVLGLAREARAAFGGDLRVPEIKIPLNAKPYSGFEVVVESPVVHRFYSTVIRNVKAKPSPEWMQENLRNYGIEPINILVDVTNYVMIETGMPMHAFDLERMHGNKLILRQAKDGESFVSFDGGQIKLGTGDCIFAAEDGTVLGIAGVVGGKDSGIHETTTDVLLECAAYDRVSIRKSMFARNAMTDAALRHSHDLSASLCDYALARAASLLMEYGAEGDAVCDGTHDYYPEPEQAKTIRYKTTEVRRLGGVEVDQQNQIDILKRLEFGVTVASEGELEVTPPLFRTDIFASEDIVEEVLRIFGYENIPSTILADVIPDPIVQPELVVEEKSRDILTSLGMDEVITVPMSTKEKLEKTNDPYLERSIELINPSSSEHTTLRTNMFTGLLEATRKVLDRGDESVSFFEIGKIYLKKKEAVHQPPHTPEFPYMELRKVAGILASKRNEYDFYDLKGIVEEYLKQLRIEGVTYVRSDHAQFELSANIMQADRRLGILGVFKREVSEREFDIKADVLGVVLNVDELVEAKKSPVSYMPYSPYPAVKQDMSVLVDDAVLAGDLLRHILESDSLVRNAEITDTFIKDGKKSLLFSITYQSKERTLSTDEVNQIHQKIGDELASKYGVVIRGRDETAQQSSKVASVPLGEKAGEQAVYPAEALSKIVVGKILKISQHPNADKLVVCNVDVGDAKPEGTLYPDYLQIITGAKNISEGDYVPIALPGALIPGLKNEDGSPVIIKKGNLRGEKSEGMMCSMREMGVGTDHSGIWILDGERFSSKIGQVFDKDEAL